MMRSQTYQTPTPTTDSHTTTSQQLPTFLDHIHELRRRLFWVVAVVLIASSVAYGFVNDIINVLTYPLGDQRLFYLTPAGGLTFTFQLCAYVGLMAAVPVIMFHLYRFLEPLMGKWRKSAVFYVGLSTCFAVAGILFAYYLTLPAALHFLTNFNLGHIQAMLTVDSYLSFVLTYLLGAALLFQIPLLLLIVNTMTPLKPSKLMKAQRFVLVGAFVLAAIISPTPDIMNQTFLALPIIGMYQLGVIMVWFQNRRVQRREQKAAKHAAQPQMRPVRPTETARAVPAAAHGSYIPADVLAEIDAGMVSPVRRIASAPKRSATQARPVTPAPVRRVLRPGVYRDIMVNAQAVTPQPVKPVAQIHKPASAATQPKQLVARPAPALQVPKRSVDGFDVYQATVPASAS